MGTLYFKRSIKKQKEKEKKIFLKNRFIHFHINTSSVIRPVK